MTNDEKQEFLYILESRLHKYITTARAWFNTTAKNIKGTYVDRISGELPLYFKSNARKWQSLIPNVSPFCFCFTKDLGISNMLNNDLRITDILEQLSEEGLDFEGLRVVAKRNTHLLGTSQQALIIYPKEYELETENKDINVSLSFQEALQLAENPTVARSIKQKITRQLQQYNNKELSF